MDSERKEKLSGHAPDTNGDVVEVTTSNIANGTEHSTTDATQGSLFHHAGHEGSADVVEDEHAESPPDVVENKDTEVTAAEDEKSRLPGTENDVEVSNSTSNNEEADAPEYQQGAKAENSPENIKSADNSATDTTILQHSEENHSAEHVHSLHIQEVESNDDKTNGHIATQDEKSEIPETEPALDLPVDNEHQNENSVAENTSKSFVEAAAPDFSSFAPTQGEELEIDWGQNVDAENADLFGQGSVQDWSNGDFLAESNDTANERPDPESQGYSLLNDEDDQFEDHQDPEMGNTSADFQAAEPDEPEESIDPFAEASQQQNDYDDGRVAAFSQVHGNASESSNALEFVAHQLVDPSNPVPRDMSEERVNDVSESTDNQQANNWWENTTSNEVFDFSALETEGGFDDDFDPMYGKAQGVLKQDLQSQSDPFAEILRSDQADVPLDPFNTKDELATSELFDDQSFAELFPVSGAPPSNPTSVEPLKSNLPAPVSSLFDDGTDAANLFNAPGNFLVSKQETILDPTDAQPAQPEVQTSNLTGAESGAGAGTEDLIDDLDFIDDSEFMAAFGSASAVTSPQTPQTQPSAPVQSPQNRYAPQPSVPYSAPSPSVPQNVAAVTPVQPATANTPTPRSISNRYAPSTAPRPSTGSTANTTSPQISTTQPGWNQPAPPSSQPDRPSPTSKSSFVTAKGGYSSPYDLPPQIASKAKRHTPAPIPTAYQNFPDVRGPLSADFRTSQPVGPPLRAASAQPHFPTQQSFPPLSSQPQQSNFYQSPQQVASPPIHSPQFPGQTSYAPPQVMSPPVKSAAQGARPSPYAPVKPVSPPAHRTTGTMAASQSMHNLGQQISAPQRTLSPPTRYIPAGSNVYPPQRVASPLYQPSQSGLGATGMHQQSGPAPPTQAGPRYGSTQAAGAQRSVSVPQPPQRSGAYMGDLPADLPLSRYNRAASPSVHHLHPNIPQAPPSQARNFPPPQAESHMSFRPAPPPQQVPPPQYPSPTDTFYQQPVYDATYLEDNPHADLPPHFEMERDDWNQQSFDPEGLVDLTEQLIDRTIQKTPEPIGIPPQDASNDVSPPRPWERAASLQAQSPPKTRSFSPYDPKMASQVPAPPAPPNPTERQRSISPLATRATPQSPKKELPMDRSQSYPSRKPPSHLKFPPPSSTQSAPRTQEEDFQSRRGGYPLVSFGFGGKLITMIPRTPHRVNIHGVAPLAVPGNITFTYIGDILEPPVEAKSFPGPLFVAGKPVKGRAKDIGAWLDENLAQLDHMRESPNLEEEEILRIEDKKVLLKLLRVLVDHNGVIDGSPEVEKAVKDILLPQVASISTTEETPSFGVTASALAMSATAQTKAPDPTALATYNLTADFLRSIRTSLMQGDRQGAIRKAVDQKMWGHALLIAGSVNPTVWRETAEQFIRSELRDTGSTDFDSLRFLYGVLGGQGSDAVNELLPPTNRMISSINPLSAAQAPRFGSWKESLGMVLQNSSSVESCSAALVGLGSSLVSYGRIEAGHSWFSLVCDSNNISFLLAKYAKCSAADIPDTQYTLLGADQYSSKGNYVALPQILLSEIFEYTQTKHAPEGLSHLLPYKLWHAWALADYGYTELASKYCESVGASLQKERKGSIFTSPIMVNVLRELTERISEGGQGGLNEKSTWFGKRTTRGDKFWKSLETNLTKFVAGEEGSDDSAASVAGKKSLDAQDPRFGRIASDTNLNRMASLPNLRAQATTPVYGTFPQDSARGYGAHSRYSTNTSDRYAPSSRYDPASVQEVQEDNLARAEYVPSSGFASPEPMNSGYSPYAPPAPPSLPAETYEPRYEPRKEPEPASPVEDKAHERQRSDSSEKSTKGKDKKGAPDKAAGGWFGGWFKRGTAEPEPQAGTPGKPIKAKLGEESSFYYDKDLKKWVNKKAGSGPEKAAPPPPPPKRQTSKPAPVTTAVTPPVVSPTKAPLQTPTIQTHPPAPTPSTPLPASDTPLAKPTLPASRPSSTIPLAAGAKVDPLEALLSSRPASGARGAKKPARSRYVDVMNKK